MHIETLAVHAGRAIDPASSAITPPIQLSTTFERAGDGSYPHGFEYIRDDNPNRRALELCMAALENGVHAIACPSGMAAISMAIEAMLARNAGRLVLPRDMYFGIRSLLSETAFGKALDTVSVDMTDLAAIERACAESRPGLVWIETPSNPMVAIADIAAVTAIARSHGALVGVDNTWSTPLLTRPLDLGADVVVHSLTKYIGGHSDMMAGMIVVGEGGPHLDEMRAMQRHRGILAAPFDCWLALRGTSTLSARMAMHCANAMAIAQALEGHPALAQVHYPGLPSHPGHAIAARQMRQFGGMLSIEVNGGRPAAMAVAAALRIFTRATSLGGPHSLIEHRASVEGPMTQAPEGLLRLSIGLENPDDLIEDLLGALSLAPGSA